jgi:hypothetical protein
VQTALSASISNDVIELFLDFPFQFHITQTFVKEVFAEFLLVAENFQYFSWISDGKSVLNSLLHQLHNCLVILVENVSVSEKECFLNVVTLFVVLEFEALKLKDAVGGTVYSKLNGESNDILAEGRNCSISANEQKLIVSELTNKFDSVFGLEFLFDPFNGI